MHARTTCLTITQLHWPKHVLLVQEALWPSRTAVHLALQLRPGSTWASAARVGKGFFGMHGKKTVICMSCVDTSRFLYILIWSPGYI